MQVRGRILGVFVVNILLCGICLGFKDDDFQWWNYVEMSTGIANDWKASFRQDLRLGDDGGNLYYEHSDLIFTYSGLAKWLDVAGGFRLVYEKDDENIWRRENRPLMDVTFKGSLFDCSVSSRNRMEYRDFENKQDVWRYSNKFMVKLPIEITPLKLKPYTADEVFITLDDGRIDRNRLFFGVIMPLRKGIDADIYYIWQRSLSGNEWTSIEVLGTGLKFEF